MVRFSYPMRPVLFLLFITSRAALPQVEPAAGDWKPWVIQTVDYQLAAPSSDLRSELEWLRDQRRSLSPEALAQIQYWDAGAPSYRWVERLTGIIAARGINTPTATRMLALMNVAMYDATVATWRNKYLHRRPRPATADASIKPSVQTPESPSYPSEHAATAAAAAVVLGYLFPQEATSHWQSAEEAARSRLFAGVEYPSDYTAGLDLGRRVGEAVVLVARSDGSSAVWSGTVPTGPCSWRGTNPVLPLVGTWKTWVLPSGDAVRPGPPVPCDSAAKQAELAEIRSFPRAFNDQAKAFSNQTAEGITGQWYTFAHRSLFEDKLDRNPPRSARIYALMATAQYDSVVACWDGKYAYWAIRPNQLDATITTLFATPSHPSYPGAHTCASSGISEVLAYAFPSRADEIRQVAIEAGLSRITAGIHYRSDHDAGIKIGRDVSAQVIERARKDGSQ